MQVNFVDPPVIGERVRMKLRSDGQSDGESTAEADGIYHGIVLEHGRTVHFFTEGQIAGIPEPYFGLECGLADGPTTTKTVAQIMAETGTKSKPASHADELSERLAAVGLKGVAADVCVAAVDPESGESVFIDPKHAAAAQLIQGLAGSAWTDDKPAPEWLTATGPLRIDREALHALVDSAVDVVESAPLPAGLPSSVAGFMLMAAVGIMIGKRVGDDPEDFVTSAPKPA